MFCMFTSIQVVLFVLTTTIVSTAYGIPPAVCFTTIPCDKYALPSFVPRSQNSIVQTLSQMRELSRIHFRILIPRTSQTPTWAFARTPDRHPRSSWEHRGIIATTAQKLVQSAQRTSRAHALSSTLYTCPDSNYASSADRCGHVHFQDSEDMQAQASARGPEPQNFPDCLVRCVLDLGSCHLGYPMPSRLLPC
jgi:hypothetical protein